MRFTIISTHCGSLFSCNPSFQWAEPVVAALRLSAAQSAIWFLLSLVRRGTTRLYPLFMGAGENDAARVLVAPLPHFGQFGFSIVREFTRRFGQFGFSIVKGVTMAGVGLGDRVVRGLASGSYRRAYILEYLSVGVAAHL